MRIGSKHFRSIWINSDPGIVNVIDQRKLPFEFEVFKIRSAEDAYFAINHHVVRGASLIGVTAAYGVFLAGFHSREDDWISDLKEAGDLLLTSKPLLPKLKYGVGKMVGAVNFAGSRTGMIERLGYMANRFAESEISRCRQIGDHGLKLIKAIYDQKGEPVHILIHSNAGWLACIDYGIVTAPIFQAHDQGIPLYIWVDETRPRNLDAGLTVFELREHGIPHSVIVNNEEGYRLQNGDVDLVLAGCDHISQTGDVSSKIGTYMKALAAKDNGIPFYIALPSDCIGFENEERVEAVGFERQEEKAHIHERLRIKKRKSEVLSPDFDITPSHLLTGLITERGICDASKSGIESLFEK